MAANEKGCLMTVGLPVKYKNSVLYFGKLCSELVIVFCSNENICTYFPMRNFTPRLAFDLPLLSNNQTDQGVTFLRGSFQSIQIKYSEKLGI